MSENGLIGFPKRAEESVQGWSLLIIQQIASSSHRRMQITCLDDLKNFLCGQDDYKEVSHRRHWFWLKLIFMLLKEDYNGVYDVDKVDNSVLEINEKKIVAVSYFDR